MQWQSLKRMSWKRGSCLLPLVLTAVFICFNFTNATCAQEMEEIISLEDAYRLALTNHERVKIAEKEVAKSSLLPKKAIGVMLPLASAGGGYKQMEDDITSWTVTTVPRNQWYSNVEISQPIYEASFFPLRRQARQTVDLSKEGYFQTSQEILFQVAQAYYQTLKEKELVNNSEEIIKLAEEDLRVSQSKLEAGEVTEDVVVKSELSVTAAQSSLIENINQLTLAKDVLKRLIGNGKKEFEVAETAKLPALSEGLEPLMIKALNNRHDYRMVLANQKIADSEVQLE